MGSALARRTVLDPPNNITLFGAGRTILRIAFVSIGLALGAGIVPVSAQAVAQHFQLNIPRQSLDLALKEFAQQTGLQVARFSDSTEGSTLVGPLNGDLSAEQALQSLLTPQGLTYRVVNGNTIAIVKPGDEMPVPLQLQDPPPDDESKQDRTGASFDRKWLGQFRVAQADETSESPRPAAQPAPSRTETIRTDPDSAEVLVTGSRLKQNGEDGASPVLTLSREKIDRSGGATLTDVVRNILPIQSNSVTDYSNFGNVGTGQSNINLRGLGNGSTLTLINGRRFALSGNSRINGGNVYNINSIPIGAVDRIEVLKDGASAIYGSDAIAGVVNILLRKDFNGTEARVSYNNTFDTDSAVRNASITTGFSNDRGTGLFTIEAYEQNGMMGSDRSFSASADQRSRGGSDVRTTPGLLGTVYAMPGRSLPGVFLANGQPASFAAIPANQNGIGLTPADFAATAGVQDVLNQNQFMSTVPDRKTLNFMGNFDFALNDAVTLFGQVAYSHTSSFAYIYNAAEVYTSQLTIPASNPYNPFGVDVRLEKNLTPEMGLGKRGNDYNDYGLVTGLRGKILDRWDWETAFSYGQSNTSNSFAPYNRNRGSANALSTDPQVAFNWFGDPTTTTVNDAAKVDNLRGYETGSGQGVLTMFDGTIRGELFDLFGKPVQAAVGAELRRDHYEQAYVSNAVLPTSTFTGIIQQQNRKTTSVFSELEVPLPYAFDLSLAVRHEDLDEYGTTTDPRVGLRWQPIRSLILRASWGTSFRGPGADQVGSAALASTRSVVDTHRGNELVTFTTFEYADLGLKPETSDNFSAGIIFEPTAVKGLTLSVDYYSIDYKDKFSYLFPDNVVQHEDVYGAYITRAAPTAADIAKGYEGVIQSMQLGYTNLAVTKLKGIDVDLEYSWDTRFGHLSYGLVGTHTLTDEEAVAPGVAPVDKLGDYTYPKKWQGNTSLFFSHGKLDAGVTFRYVHSYDFTGYGLFNPARHIGSIKETDVQGSYDLPWNLRVTAGVNNVFNRDPPFFYAPVYYVGNFGYDNTLSSPRKATYYVNFRKTF